MKLFSENSFDPGKRMIGGGHIVLPGHRNMLWEANPGRMADVSGGPAYYTDTSTGKIVTVPGGKPLWIDAGAANAPNFRQILKDPWDPEMWIENGALMEFEGNITGDYKECRVISQGKLWHRYNYYYSGTEGSPQGIQQGSIGYKINTGGALILFWDDTTKKPTNLIYDNNGWAITSQGAAAEVSFRDLGMQPCGFSVLLFSVNWKNKSNRLFIGAGPNAFTPGEHISVFFSDLYEAESNLFPLTGPGSATIATRAGTLSQDISEDPKLQGALDGFADGNLPFNPGSIGLGWTDNGDGTYTFDGVSGSGRWVNMSNTGEALDTRIEAVIRVSDCTTGFIAVSLFGSGSNFSKNGIYKVRGTITPGATNCYFAAYGGFDGTVSFGLKRVANTAVKWTGRFNTNVGSNDIQNDTILSLLSLGELASLLYLQKDLSGTTSIRTNDGTNIAVANFTLEGRTWYEWELLCGYHIETAGWKMLLRIRKTGSAVWTESSLTSFLGRWPIVDGNLVFCKNNNLFFQQSAEAAPLMDSGWRTTA